MAKEIFKQLSEDLRFIVPNFVPALAATEASLSLPPGTKLSTKLVVCSAFAPGCLEDGEVDMNESTRLGPLERYLNEELQEHIAAGERQAAALVTPQLSQDPPYMW